MTMELKSETGIEAGNTQRVAAWDACRAALGADVNPQAAEQLERSVRRIHRM